MCHASLWSTTVTFSLFSSPSASIHSQKPLSLWLYVSNASLYTLLLSSDHWIWEYSQFALVPHQVYSFIYLLLSLLHLFTKPRLETATHLHLYGKMYCIDKNNRRIFYFLQIFQMPFTSLVNPPKTGLIMRHSDCRFVFLFVIRIGDDSGRHKWDTQQGDTDTITYS